MMAIVNNIAMLNSFKNAKAKIPKQIDINVNNLIFLFIGRTLLILYYYTIFETFVKPFYKDFFSVRFELTFTPNPITNHRSECRGREPSRTVIRST